MKKLLILLCLLAVLSAVFVGCSNMITGLTATDNTPAGADAAALTSDDITFASGDTVDAVTGNFTLPITGESDNTTISWESDNTDVITIDNETGIATVTLPAEADTEVTLTATFTDTDGNTSTVTITVTVAAQEAAAVTFESAVQTGGSSDTADSTGLTLTFDIDPTTLAAGDITVTGATKGALSSTGTTRRCYPTLPLAMGRQYRFR